MNDALEYQRQNWWMQVYQTALNIGHIDDHPKKCADAALKAFDAQFKPKCEVPQIKEP